MTAGVVIVEGQDWFWSEGWQTGEQEAEADLAGGRTIRFANAEEAIRFLRTYPASMDEGRDGPDPGNDQA
jgi:hypothetical protein